MAEGEQKSSEQKKKPSGQDANRAQEELGQFVLMQDVASADLTAREEEADDIRPPAEDAFSVGAVAQGGSAPPERASPQDKSATSQKADEVLLRWESEPADTSGISEGGL
jgi:hypothetical protein